MVFQEIRIEDKFKFGSPREVNFDAAATTEPDNSDQDRQGRRDAVFYWNEYALPVSFAVFGSVQLFVAVACWLRAKRKSLPVRNPIVRDKDYYYYY